ncbi:VWA domain-containing protein [Rossellomorea marisflavi]|uniref:vWA domain-containing protein n=1 Tax=Rossellomorea marisflavi TaxID=189381 RepID=UPI0035111287
MGIQYPFYALMGLFLIAVVLMYFFRKRYETKVVSSNLLWNQAMDEWQSSPWFHKLQRNLLLFLQLLILTFLIITLMNPYRSDYSGTTGHTVILMDTSTSMKAKKGDITHFDLAKKEAESVIKGSRGPVTILAVGKNITTKISEEANKRTSLKALNDLEMTNDHEDMQKAIQMALALAGTGEIHLFSDSVTKSMFKDLHTDATVMVHNIIENPVNISMKSFGIKEKGKQVDGVVTIANQGGEDREGTLIIHGGSKVIHQEPVVIQKGEDTVIPLSGLQVEESYMAEIRVDDDFQDDNVMTALNMSSSPAVYALGDINPFIIKGFQALGMDVKSVEEASTLDDNGILIASWKEAERTELPVLIIPDEKEEGKKIGGTVSSKKDHPLLRYADVEKIFVDKATDHDISGLSTIAEQDKVPLMQAGEIDGKKMVLMNFRLKDSDFPLSPGFPIFLYNVYHYLGDNQQVIGNFLPGEKRTIQTDGTWDLYSMNQDYIGEWKEGTTFTAPTKPGIYQALRGQDVKYFSVSIDEREKVIGKGESFIVKGEGVEKGSVPSSISSWFLALAVLFLFIEWEVYRRGNRRS